MKRFSLLFVLGLIIVGAAGCNNSDAGSSDADIKAKIPGDAGARGQQMGRDQKAAQNLNAPQIAQAEKSRQAAQSGQAAQ